MIAKTETTAIFKPNKIESKARATDAAARAIIEAEAERRDAKTLRLRAARLKAEAEKAIVPMVSRTGPVRRRKR